MSLKRSNSEKKMAHSQSEGAFFLTQKGEKIYEVKKDIDELEVLLAGATQTSQSTLLLKKRKEMREVDESLTKTKRDYITKMNECEERRRIFEEKQSKMRDQVVRFEKFIQENDAKRKRAEAKEKQERKAYEEKCREIIQLNKDLVRLIAEKEGLRRELDVKSCYRMYLERIVEEGDYGYEEIVEILNRHTTLQDANNDLMSISNGQEREVDECRVLLQDTKTKMQNEMLVLNSYTQKLQHDLELIRDDVKQLDEEKQQLEEGRKDTTREYSQVIQSIRNIFSRCSMTIQNKAVYVPSATGNNVDEWLEFVNTRITDMIEISKEYKQEIGGSVAGGPGANLEEGSSHLSYISGGLATDTSKAGFSPMMASKPSKAVLPPLVQKLSLVS